MRDNLMPWNPNSDQRYEMWKKAKKIIEEHGIDDYVVENRQMSGMGGVRYVVTSKDELDKKYVGFRGFFDYQKVCKYIERYEWEKANPEEAQKQLDALLARIKREAEENKD